jgi:propionyl-CoA:succinyl-CoA transferase
LVSHFDHNEHSVQVLVTEHGVADLPGKNPGQGAHTVIENCADPDYREQLRDYLKFVKTGQSLSPSPPATQCIRSSFAKEICAGWRGTVERATGNLASSMGGLV